MRGALSEQPSWGGCGAECWGEERREEEAASGHRDPGGGAWGPGRGTHFLGGDVLSFTTLKRFCSSFSPQ